MPSQKSQLQQQIAQLQSHNQMLQEKLLQWEKGWAINILQKHGQDCLCSHCQTAYNLLRD